MSDTLQAEAADPLRAEAAGAVLTGIGRLYRQRSAFDPVAVSIGHLEDVGRFNIIGEKVTLWGTVRCAVEADMAEVEKRLVTLAEHTAQAYNCTAQVDYLQPVPASHSKPEWVAAALPTFRRVVGTDRVAWDHLTGTLEPTAG
ncbi:hypothetical protein [Streptomyces sp. CB01881]|uniref:hypothetical protein n=1 Tax=Streptomyces sp. CB01881 TaxID=2078691 RepID=UPI001F11EA28|nr:hypothetical protein [Streptomyces sp. CB01881]